MQLGDFGPAISGQPASQDCCCGGKRRRKMCWICLPPWLVCKGKEGVLASSQGNLPKTASSPSQDTPGREDTRTAQVHHTRGPTPRTLKDPRCTRCLRLARAPKPPHYPKAKQAVKLGENSGLASPGEDSGKLSRRLAPEQTFLYLSPTPPILHARAQTGFFQLVEWEAGAAFAVGLDQSFFFFTSDKRAPPGVRIEPEDTGFPER